MITVHERAVASPWEQARLAQTRRVSVGREADVRPEPGPLADYQRAFPARYVTWSVRQQLFEIRERNPFTGHDERVEYVFLWDAPPDPDTPDQPRSPEELSAMVETRDGALRRVFRPFDYPFVARRLRERFEIEHDGYARVLDRLMARNRAITKTWERDRVRHTAAGMNEIKRYLPVLAGLRPDGRPEPMVPGFGGGTRHSPSLATV